MRKIADGLSQKGKKAVFDGLKTENVILRLTYVA
jgi:hypothetical protein